MKDNLKDIAWTEKYRPTSVKDVISSYKSKILKYMENVHSIPNFLFHSKIGGTGKSSMARTMIEDMGCDKLILNASADRSIDMIRTTVKQFASSKSSNGGRRCVFMDEAERLTKDAAEALKNMIEEFSSNTFYIFTTNSVEKLSQPLRSRFIEYEFTQPDKDDVKKFLIDICTREGLLYTEESLIKLIDTYYPSIRNCVNKLQDIHTSGESLKDGIKSLDNKNVTIFNMIKAQAYTKVREMVLKGEINSSEFNSWLFYYLPTSGLELKNQIALNNVLAQNERDFKIGCDAKLIFVASLTKMIVALK